jgi:hypothetical protein
MMLGTVRSILLGAFVLTVSTTFSLAAAQSQRLELSPAELFAFADSALQDHDIDTAEAAYRALTRDADLDIRTEARFRLAMLLADVRNQPEAAAVELRRILDDKPEAARVRIELASILASLGDTAGAHNELRRAQAGALPPDVARFVEFYSQALRSQRIVGASLEFAFAPDSNINRATSSSTLGTILGDFILSDDARESSGIGLSLKQQAYWRPRLNETTALLARLSASENLYRNDDFNDLSATVQVGPEFRVGSQSVSVAGVYGRRWFGGSELSRSSGVTTNYATPIDTVTMLRLDGSLIDTDDRRNDGQDGYIYSLGASLEHAFSPTTGGALQFSTSRLDAADPGYATTSGGLSLIGFHDINLTSLVASISYTHLEADERLLLFAKKRADDRYAVSAGATFRQLSYAGFAPFVRATYERNASTVGIYTYGRVSGEFGLARAF